MLVLTVDVRWVGVPLITRVAHSEPVGVAQGRGEVDVAQSFLRLDVIELVKPCACSEHIGVRASTDLRFRPAMSRRKL
jgi:hypothetical protein